MTEMNPDGTYPYRPPNGTAGEMFMERFCYRCKRDQKFQETQDGDDSCPIARDSWLYEVDEAGYPKEWIADDNVGLKNPRCTAFEEVT